MWQNKTKQNQVQSLAPHDLPTPLGVTLKSQNQEYILSVISMSQIQNVGILEGYMCIILSVFITVKLCEFYLLIFKVFPN